jgi:hypothetical protein
VIPQIGYWTRILTPPTDYIIFAVIVGVFAVVTTTLHITYQKTKL